VYQPQNKPPRLHHPPQTRHKKTAQRQHITQQLAPVNAFSAAFDVHVMVVVPAAPLASSGVHPVSVPNDSSAAVSTPRFRTAMSVEAGTRSAQASMKIPGGHYISPLPPPDCSDRRLQRSQCLGASLVNLLGDVLVSSHPIAHVELEHMMRYVVGGTYLSTLAVKERIAHPLAFLRDVGG
jgi:hypothetical protein